MRKVTITFHPSKKQIEVDPGTTILEAARSAGLRVRSACGADAACGKCRVVVKKGKIETSPTGLLTPDEIKHGLVLACNTRVLEAISVEIPPESKAGEGEQPDRQGLTGILLSGQGRTANPDLLSNTEAPKNGLLSATEIMERSPLSAKVFLKLPPPTLQDTAGDLERVCRTLRQLGFEDVRSGLANLRNLGAFLRRNNWSVTATLGRRHNVLELIQLEGGDTSQTNYGLAVDIGTTTVVVHLVDLVNRETVCSAGAFNKQIDYGDDIITRIIFASEKSGLEKLHQAVADTINNLIQSCIADCLAFGKNIRLEDITCLVCAGNPTMTHILLEIDPGHLRREPYVPVANDMPVIRVAQSGIRINPQGLLFCAPGVSSYIGADITAGLLFSGLADQQELAMYIDMGTNGEIVLGNKDWLACCACSIGPAFEGSGISCGVRAVQGAIHKIKIANPDKPAVLETVGDGKPSGICGSGLIELISELLKAGIINKAGKISAQDGPASGGQLIRKGVGGMEYLVAPKDKSVTGRDIVLTQSDIDHIIRSKAAVYAGISTLLKKMNYTVRDISRFYIAGGFGSHLDIAKAITIGLLPNAPLDRFSYIGNGSVEGARMILLSYIAMAKAHRIADKMTYIELSADNSFTEEFISAIFLPHTDLNLFAGG
jgi:uncharacterized 2Fe-2S/4Fe-4S cluster protein (DUF4445 family)